MGVDIHVRVLKYNEGEWKPVWLYRNDNGIFKRIPPYDNRWSELFEILAGEGQYEDIPTEYINEKDLPEETLKDYQDEKDWCYGFAEVNLADLQNYVLRHPLVKDCDVAWPDNEPIPLKDNPVKEFIEQIVNYIRFEDEYFFFGHSFSKIKIIFWFDH